MAEPFVTRFAPSPTGYLHRGHAASALAAWSAAKAAGDGVFLLRIEDIDATRCRPDYELAILEDIQWLGLDWTDPVRRQSDHMPDYYAALEQLQHKGLVYRCFRTRRDVLDEIARAPHGPGDGFRSAPLPRGEEDAKLAAQEPFAWRLSLDAAQAHLGAAFAALSFTDETGPVAARPELAGDVVLARKDVGVAYHLACVVDDALQGVTHVIRGEDLREAAHIQRLLQALLNLPTPVYRHHALICGPDGKRLAKRDMAENLRDLRTRGVTAEEVRASVGF